MIARRRLLCLAAGTAITGPAITGTASPARAAEAAVLAPVQQLCDSLLEIMKLGSTAPFAQRFARQLPVIDAVFDLGTILQVSIGPAWGPMTAEQKSALSQAFQRYTVASYVNSFDSYTGQRFDVLPETRALANGDQVVQTRIVPRSGDGHKLDYVMRHEQAKWKVVDVLADGAISRVAVQRSDFRRLLSQGGVATLVDSLNKKTADLSSGAV